MTTAPSPTGEGPALSRYQKSLLAFLSVATFFEGYDFFALTQLLPNLRAHFDLSPSQGAFMVGVINAGTVLAYLLIGWADRVGRTRLLRWTILGYAFFSLLSGLAPSALVFTLSQAVARVFLIGEWAASMLIAAEEFPAKRRGTAIGIISAAGGFGAIVCAGVVPLLLKTPLGWRSVYLIGVVPLLLISYARKNLKETERFLARGPVAHKNPILLWPRGQGRRVLEMGLIWLLCYVCSQNAVTFWKEFAVGERGLSDAQVGSSIVLAALVALPAAFAAGPFLDAVGRRLGGSVLLGLLAIGTFGAYTAHSVAALTGFLVLAMIGANTMLTLLNTLTTELFPTEHRGSAFAWSNNLIGRIGYWGSPFVLGPMMDALGWGAVIRWTAVFPLVAVATIWLLLPETKGRELEETAGA